MTSSWIKASVSAGRKVRRFPSRSVYRQSRSGKLPSGARRNKLMDALRTIAEQVVHRATKMGASAADAFIREEETFSVTVRMGEVETLKEAVSRGLRLRVFLGKKTAISQTSDLTPAIVDKLVDETVEMAQLTSEDESGGLPDASVF